MGPKRSRVWAMMLRRMMRIDEATGIMLECTDKAKEVDDRIVTEDKFRLITSPCGFFGPGHREERGSQAREDSRIRVATGNQSCRK